MLKRQKYRASSLPVVTQNILIMSIACSCFLGQLPDALLMVFIIPITPSKPDFLLRKLNTQVLMSLGHLLHRPQPENQRGGTEPKRRFSSTIQIKSRIKGKIPFKLCQCQDSKLLSLIYDILICTSGTELSLLIGRY